MGTLQFDNVEAEILQLPRIYRYPRDGYGSYAPGLTREAVIQARQNFLDAIEKFREPADSNLVVALRDELWQCVPLYEEAKRRAGVLDFTDLLIKTRDLLRNPKPRDWFREQYDCLFIDEFQDTDPLQAEILLTLASNDCDCGDWRELTPSAGKLFVVGDPKQSIYRFRRADIGLYRSVRESLGGCGVARDELQSSHRSLTSIQAFVNAAFEPAIPEYLPLSGGRPPLAGQPAMIALPMPAPYGTRNMPRAAIEKCSPPTVAAFIEWLVEQSEWNVEDRGSLRPIQHGDICLLFRRFTSNGEDLAQEYVRALEARSIEHVLVGSKSFHQREEVEAIRTAMRAIEWPDDELSVYATLRTFFGLLDEALIRFKHSFGNLYPHLDRPDDAGSEHDPVFEALAILSELHRRRNHHPIAATINRLLEETRAHAAFAFRKAGRRVLANVYRVLDLARSFGSSEATSFRSFIDYLESELDGGEASEAPVFEQSSGGVKLMTVHKAKGLEFSVVILVDCTANLTSQSGCDRYLDTNQRLCAQRLLGWAPPDLLDHLQEESEADRDEALRLAYVAATRARDLLVVSAVGAPEFLKEDGIGRASWLSPLYNALYPPREHWRVAGEPPGLATIGHRSVLRRPRDWDDEEDSVRPGLHSVAGREVVWFDPALLDLDQPKQPGLDHEAVLTGAPDQIRAGLEAYRSWRERRDSLIEAAKEPAYRVAPALDVHGVPSASGVTVETVKVPGHEGRPGSRPFGRLVHLLLERLDAKKDREAIQKLAKALAAMCGAHEHEIPPAIEAATAALETPVLTAATTAVRVHREYPVMVKLDDGRLVEGRADLAYFDGIAWTVIDFKTGPAASKRNREQLQLYALALGKATGQPVRAVLLEV